MPAIMSLEGPQLSRIQTIRAQLNAPQWSRRQGEINGLGASFLDPLITHPVVFAIGIVAGFWLAGSAAGQKLLKKK